MCDRNQCVIGICIYEPIAADNFFFSTKKFCYFLISPRTKKLRWAVVRKNMHLDLDLLYIIPLCFDYWQ